MITGGHCSEVQIINQLVLIDYIQASSEPVHLICIRLWLHHASSVTA